MNKTEIIFLQFNFLNEKRNLTINVKKMAQTFNKMFLKIKNIVFTRLQHPNLLF